MKVCSVEGCTGRYRARGMCGSHYARWMRGTFHFDSPYVRPRCPCVFEGCESMTSGMLPTCNTHTTLLWRYNLTPIQYRMLIDRGCAICGSSGTARALHIDHDHACCPASARSCGECVRGALCHHCNVAIGALKENPELFLAAIAYLT